MTTPGDRKKAADFADAIVATQGPDALTAAQVIFDTICERISEGESLRSICRSDGMPAKQTVLKWLASNGAFAAQYARARGEQADHYADEIIAIADSAEDAAKARLQVDARKWVAAKLKPKKYGEKVAVVGGDADDAPVRHQIDLSRLTEDQLRALASVRLPTDT